MAFSMLAFLVGIALTGLVANFLWYLFCALALGWGDSAPLWYINIQGKVFYGIFLGSALVWLGGIYWFRSKDKNMTEINRKA